MRCHFCAAASKSCVHHVAGLAGCHAAPNEYRRFATCRHCPSRSYYPNLSKASGSDYLAKRVQCLRPLAHVFGHT